MATELDSNDDVYFVPALAGLVVPYRDPYARGMIIGLTRGTTRHHLVRAALESRF
ncbi:MAG: FGGY-family carbohydrate kinase [Desulfuromonas sp.]